MSVINEALKRAGEPEKKQASPPRETQHTAAKRERARLSKAWMIALAAVLIAVFTLYAKEVQGRQKAQAKLQAALLQLNDARSQAMEAAEQRGRAVKEKEAIAAKKQEVEYDNFEKEKKISDLAKEVHELKMSGSQPAQA